MYAIVAMFCFAAFAVGLMGGVAIADGSARFHAIEHGCAHYDSKTAAFTWNQ